VSPLGYDATFAWAVCSCDLGGGRKAASCAGGARRPVRLAQAVQTGACLGALARRADPARKLCSGRSGYAQRRLNLRERCRAAMKTRSDVSPPTGDFTAESGHERRPSSFSGFYSGGTGTFTPYLERERLGGWMSSRAGWETTPWRELRAGRRWSGTPSDASPPRTRSPGQNSPQAGSRGDVGAIPAR